MAEGLSGPARTASLDEAALAWIEKDPDPSSRQAARDLLEAAARGDADSVELLARFFGPAPELVGGALSAPIGPGPGGMSLASAMRAAAALCSFLADRLDGVFRVLVGFDESPGAAERAEAISRVVEGAGGRAILMPRPLPLPLSAFSMRLVLADAALVATGPAEGIGSLIVFLGGRAATGPAEGARIGDPEAAELSARIAAAPGASSLPLSRASVQRVGEQMIDAYIDRLVLGLDPRPKATRIVLVATPATADLLSRALERLGFSTVVHLDADLERALAFTDPGAADLILAPSPTGEGCRIGVPAQWGAPAWRLLDPDEVGTLLGEQIARTRAGDEDALFATTLSSSRTLEAIARRFRVPHQRVLPGIGALVRRPGLVFGYGAEGVYCLDPAMVHDADGLAVALRFALLIAMNAARGRGARDLFCAQARAFGYGVVLPFSLEFSDPRIVTALMKRLREGLIEEAFENIALLDRDFATGVDGVEAAELLEFVSKTKNRLLIGTGTALPELIAPGARAPRTLAAILEIDVAVDAADHGPSARQAAISRADAIIAELTAFLSRVAAQEERRPAP